MVTQSRETARRLAGALARDRAGRRVPLHLRSQRRQRAVPFHRHGPLERAAPVCARPADGTRRDRHGGQCNGRTRDDALDETFELKASSKVYVTEQLAAFAGSMEQAREMLAAWEWYE